MTFSHYICIRASFSQERMQYLDQEATVIYDGKNQGVQSVKYPHPQGADTLLHDQDILSRLVLIG